jgi:hypothetical protein
MIDIATAYNRYRFLGNEFLTWIWFCIENHPALIQQCDPDLVSLTVGNRMVLENRLSNGSETITIKGDAAGLEEALLSLKKGAWITEMNLVYKSGVSQWKFGIKGESLGFSGLKLPESLPLESGDEAEWEGRVLERIYFYEKIFEFVQNLYRTFIKARLSNQWKDETLTHMKKWLQAA